MWVTVGVCGLRGQGLEERLQAAGAELRDKEELVERLRGEAKAAVERAAEAGRAAAGASGRAAELVEAAWESVGALVGRAEAGCSEYLRG